MIGARQVGKTTLAREVARKSSGPVFHFDLESPEDRSRLVDPMFALKPLKGLVILDEVQNLPDVFRVLRVLADRQGLPVRFLILGSASPELLRQSSESLAGRIYYHRLDGFSLQEVGIRTADRLWLRGAFPRSYLARTSAQSDEWRLEFIRTFLERDIPQLGIRIPSTTLHRFWNMLAHYHGQIWNSSEFARSFGVADTTVRNYLDVLSAALVVRELQPWHENLSKRQVKSPKVYLSDSGLLHSLLRLPSMMDLERHPKVGASWEGFVIQQIIRYTGARVEESFFWATHSGAELDLLVVRGRKRFGFEIKRTSSPRVTPSMRSALSDLGLTRLDIIHAGDHTFTLEKGMRAVAFARCLELLQPL